MTFEDFLKVENILWVARNSGYDLDKLVDEFMDTLVLTKKQKREELCYIRRLVRNTLYTARYGRGIG